VFEQPRGGALEYCTIAGFGRCIAPEFSRRIRGSEHQESVVTRVLDEAQAIWEPADITFDWHRITSKDARATWQVTVTIDDQQKDFGEWQRALG
jgi:hypothetical protein